MVLRACYALSGTERACGPALHNPIQETAISVQLVPGVWFLTVEFAVGGSSPRSPRAPPSSGGKLIPYQVRYRPTRVLRRVRYWHSVLCWAAYARATPCPVPAVLAAGVLCVCCGTALAHQHRCTA
eukprot:3941816-Rhodomonas_salina.2